MGDSAAVKDSKFFHYFNLLRRYKWVIIFPSVSFYLIFKDYTRTLRYKAAKAQQNQSSETSY